MFARALPRNKRGSKSRRMILENLESRQMLDASDLPGLSFDRFESAAELSQFLLDDALRRYEGLFGQQTWGGAYDYWGHNRWFMAMDGVAVPATNNHSETNTQVAGVDEADIIETDGDFLYVLGDKELVIVDAVPAGEMQVASRVAIDGTPFAEFLIGNRLGVLSHTAQPHYYLGGGPVLIDVAMPSIWPGPYREPQIQLTLLDVADRAAPKIVSETRFDGSFTDARAIGGTLYVVSSGRLGIPAPEMTCVPIEDKPDEPVDAANGDVAARFAAPWYYPQQNCVYETREAFVTRVSGREIELGVPQMTSTTGDLAAPDAATVTSVSQTGQTTTPTSTTGTSSSGGPAVTITGPLSQPTDIYRPAAIDYYSLVSITSFDLTSDLPGAVASTSLPTTSTSTVYASPDAMYLANPDWGLRWTGDYGTSIIKFDLEDGGRVNLAAHGTVPGQLLNQFALDEHEGFLRVATTQGWGMSAENAVYVLGQRGTSLDIVGSITGLAPGERIFAVRFMGDRGFVVTFRQVDPLFTLDLSDPAAPTVVGELHIPGFSNYLQAADDSHMIGIGRNADLDGRVRELQVSLFNVADMTNPQLADRYAIDVGSWSWSEATTDHHAVGFYPEYDVLAIPVTNGGGWEWIDRDGDGANEFYSYRPRTDLWVFKLNLDPTFAPVPLIELLGRVEHDGHIRRSVRIDDVLYAISENTVTAHAILNPDRRLGSLHFGRETIGVPLLPSPVDDPVIALAVDSPELTAPLVTGAAVASSAWSPAVVSHMEASGLSTTSGNSAAATDVSGNNVDQIKLTFNEDVAVGQADLAVTGANGAEYSIVGFAYDADSRTAVWTLQGALPADQITVTLSDAATDRAGNRLDGDRNGTSGGQFKFTFSSLPGDANRDGAVDAADLAATMAANFRRVTDANFDLALDVDGDGAISFRDTIAVRNRMGTTLPATTAPAPLAVIAGTGSRRTPGVQRRPEVVENAREANPLRSASRRDRLTASAVDIAVGGTTQPDQSITGRTRRIPR